MSFLAALPIIGGVIEKILDLFPDGDKKEELKAKLLSQEMAMELAKIEGQLKINMEEAKHSSIWVAGWRPFIGWACGCAFVWHFILQPVIVFFGVVFDHPIPIPYFDVQPLLYTLSGMLGIGMGLRTYEKAKGLSK